MNRSENFNAARRTVLVQALAGAGLLVAQPLRALAAPWVENVTKLYPVQVARVEVPQGAQQVADLVRAWPGRVAVGGGRYSMGGQVAVSGGLHLDMRGMNRLLWLDNTQRRVRVQAGMRWRDLQDCIDPVGLAVKTMQSYSNFTVGGAVSVNAHGRYVGHGPVGNTVRALQLVLADGSIVECSRTQRPELFSAAVGGYGAVGVITEVELDLAENCRIERAVAETGLDAYPAYFRSEVLARGDSVMHNADLLPPHFDRAYCTTWRRTEKPLTQKLRLTPRDEGHAVERSLLWIVTELPGGQRLEQLRPWLSKKPVVQWLNREASLDVAELEPADRQRSTYVLQEYFVPAAQLPAFSRAMVACLQRHRVNALNISIRHSPADGVALLPWAKQEVFALVLYYKQATDAAACEAVGRWTRELIDLALAHGGRYYLPYQLHATQQQFERAYPEVQRLRELKAGIDPDGRFSNSLWAQYL